MASNQYDVILACGDRYATKGTWGHRLGVEIGTRLRLGGLLIHGAAKGIDTLSEEMTSECDRTVERYPADWEKHKKSAGPIRNRVMLLRLQDLEKQGNSVAVIGFHDDLFESKGTKDMLGLARKNGVPTYWIQSDGHTRTHNIEE